MSSQISRFCIRMFCEAVRNIAFAFPGSSCALCTKVVGSTLPRAKIRIIILELSTRREIWSSKIVATLMRRTTLGQCTNTFLDAASQHVSENMAATLSLDDRVYASHVHTLHIHLLPRIKARRIRIRTQRRFL